ncbi:MAG: hypothetical protein EP346_01015 [Bacteroidetes bacterium]|nr:MAG: hypothetical protein EP346_01015 [Bacteroidota bacterium]
MIKFAPLISIHNIDQSFPLRQAEWTFSKNLSGVSNQRTRLNIDIVDTRDLENTFPDGGVKMVRKYFDVEDYNRSNNLDKRNKLLKLIQEAFIEISEHTNWNIDRIHQAYESSILEELNFSYASDYKSNKTRSFKARIEVELEDDKVKLFGRIVDKNGEFVKRVHFIDTTLQHAQWFRSFRVWRWIDPLNFGFIFGKNMSLTISVKDDSSTWNHDDTLPEHKFMEWVTYGKLTSLEDFVKWASW